MTFRSPTGPGAPWRRSAAGTAASALLLLLLLAAVVRAGEGLDPAVVSDLYSQSKDLLRAADGMADTDPEKAAVLYRKSVLRLERIVGEGGVRNGRIYYNIGNAWFRMKDVGRAILNYRRAEQYAPNDTNLQQNLQSARERRRDRVEEKQKTRVLKTLFFWHYDLSTRARVLVFAVAFGTFWLLATLHLFLRRWWLRRVLAVAGAAALLFGLSLAHEEGHLRRTRPGVVLADEVVARKGNGRSYQPSFTDPLHAGTEFELVESRGDWVHIELADGRRCWLPDPAVERVR